jgi:plasmid stabilization system protein ParE
MKFEFHPDALEEYQAAARYYADCQPGLELRFMASIEAALATVSEAPLRWSRFEDDVRRYSVRVFPYNILYTIESDFVLIVAVMHCSRKPGYWRERIGY